MRTGTMDYRAVRVLFVVLRMVGWACLFLGVAVLSVTVWGFAFGHHYSGGDTPIAILFSLIPGFAIVGSSLLGLGVVQAASAQIDVAEMTAEILAIQRTLAARTGTEGGTATLPRRAHRADGRRRFDQRAGVRGRRVREGAHRPVGDVVGGGPDVEAGERPPVVLRTARLTLRPCRPDDRDDFIALERDPDVMRFLNGGQPVDHDHADPEATFLMPRGTEPHVWTARGATDGAFVGWFCLWPEGEGTAELGYRLRRSAWGQGLASEGAFALVDWGFRSGGYERVVATTMAVNLGSRRVMEKLGMTHRRTTTFDGPEPIPGSEHGEVWYEATRSDWQGR